MGDTAGELLASAQGALAAGDCDGAVAAATASLAEHESGEGRFLLGALHMIDERYLEAAGEWQVAFRLLCAEGRPRRAARAAIELVRLLGADLGYRAVAQGWAERARAVLDRVGPCVEWGHLELAYLACERPDIDDLLASAERARAIAAEYGDAALEALALADGGLALVTQGRTHEGFARLDAALAAITAGDVDWDTAGICYCSMLTACDRAADVRRATEWTAMMSQVVDRMDRRPRMLHIHCRLAYGSVLRSSGRWPEAEAALLDALGPRDAPNIAHRALTVAHLADLRIDQGRVDEAADLLAPFEDSVTSCGPLARVHQQRGELDMAAAVLRRGLSEMVGDALRGARLLATLVDVELARDDLGAARAAADELGAIADDVDLAAVRAAAETAGGRVCAAGGDDAGARMSFAAAKARLADGDSPMALGTVRLALAETLADGGDLPAAVAEARAALACFERIGARPARDRADALLRAWGDTGRTRPRDATAVVGALTRREREVLEAVARGLTNAEIADHLYISAKTVEHHVGRVLAKLGVRSRAEAAALSVRLAASGKVPGGK